LSGKKKVATKRLHCITNLQYEIFSVKQFSTNKNPAWGENYLFIQIFFCKVIFWVKISAIRDIKAEEWSMANKPKEIRVNFPKELAGGAYSNNMVVSHTKEEFIMDFLMVAPPSGALTARIIVSPGHIKRIIKALQENISRYEQKFGSIQPAEEPMEKVTLQ
jgi:hypothetical protein